VILSVSARSRTDQDTAPFVSFRKLSAASAGIDGCVGPAVSERSELDRFRGIGRGRLSIIPVTMDYSVGSRVRVKLYSGKIVEAEITAITNQSAGRKIRIFFESASVVINPEQIIEVLD
jgi:hypothetical protein